MSYRCHRCAAKVEHGQPLRRHVIRRQDGTIAREVPVCDDCACQLADGAPMAYAVAAKTMSQAQAPEVLTQWPQRQRRS